MADEPSDEELCDNEADDLVAGALAELEDGDADNSCGPEQSGEDPFEASAACREPAWNGRACWPTYSKFLYLSVGEKLKDPPTVPEVGIGKACWGMYREFLYRRVDDLPPQDDVTVVSLQHAQQTAGLHTLHVRVEDVGSEPSGNQGVGRSRKVTVMEYIIEKRGILTGNAISMKQRNF